MNWINRFLLANWSQIFDALLLTRGLLVFSAISDGTQS